MKPMTDKVAFITGAASGIGRATALAFAKQGTRVMIADVQSSLGRQLEKEIEEQGGTAQYIDCDVASEESIRNALEQMLSTFGGLDYAFNNAGIEGQMASTLDCTNENWDRVLSINLKGVWLCMKYQLPLLLRRGGGSIVNCSSIAGLVGFSGIPAYVASKHGVVGLTKTAALEYAKANIRINAVCPGVIKTPMIERFIASGAREADLVQGEPMGRMGLPEEVASMVLWLSSPDASFVIGQALAVDGGWTAQ